MGVINKSYMAAKIRVYFATYPLIGRSEHFSSAYT